MAIRDALLRDVAPSHGSIASAFVERVRAHPASIALFDRERSVTYAELESQSLELARGLVSRGVIFGDHVGLALPRSIDSIAAMLAVFRIGAVLVPIDPEWPEARRTTIARDAKLAFTIDSSTAPALREASLPVTLASDGEDVALALYTSGSTGEPKAVLLSHGALLWRCHALAQAMPYAADDVACHRTPPTFVDAYSEIFGPLLHGVPSYVVPHPLAIADLVLALDKVTRLLLVPSVLAVLLDANPDLGKLRLIATSGEPISEALASRCLAAAPHARLVNIYGSTEVAGDATYADLTDGIVTIGRPLEGVTTAILDADANGIGELAIAGPILADGYWQRRELTAQRFIELDGVRMFRTGDRARRLVDGRLVLEGRIDDQVKIAGVRVELREVEHALLAHCAAAAVVAETVGERTRLVAAVVSELEPSAIRAHVAGVLPVVPLIIRVSAIPMTTHGKVDRRAILALTNVDPRMPVGDDLVGHKDLVVRCVQWFHEVTGQTATPPSVFENLGGDSLARLALRVRVERAGYHVDLPAPLTPAALADVLGAGAPREMLALDGVTDFQRVMILESIANRGTAMWTDQLAYTIEDAIDSERFETAWRDVVATEPALRTTFSWKGETIRSVVHREVPFAIDHVDLRALELEPYRLRVLAEEWTRISLSFPLDAAPLFAIALLQGPARSDLIFTYHHAILDGESARRVLRAVLARYAGREVTPASHTPHRIAIDPRWREMFTGFVPGPEPMPAKATRMGDTVWRVFHRILAFRSKRAAARVRRRSKPIRALLAAARLTPPAYSGGDITTQPLASSHAAALRTWAAAHGTTPMAIWVAAFALHLARERRTRDVAFGVLVSNRDGRSAEAIGMLANCLPLRVTIDDAASTLELVAEIGRRLALLEQLSATPLLELAAELGLDPRLFLDTQVISWGFAQEQTEVRGGRGITMTAPTTALIVSNAELAVGAREFHRTDRIRREVLAIADAILDNASVIAILARSTHEGGLSIALPDL